MRYKVWNSAVIAIVLLCIHVVAPASRGEDIKRALLLNKEGEKLLDEGKPQQAQAVFQEMLGSCGAHEFCKGVALFYLGRAQEESGHFETAMNFLDQAEKVLDGLGKRNESATVLLSKGKAQAGLGDYRKALEYFTRAEAVFTSVKNTKELFTLFNSTAVVYAYLCDYQRALEYLEKAEPLVGDPPDPKRRGPLSHNRGLVYSKKQEYDAAQSCYAAALNDYQSVGNVRGVAVIMNNIGQVHESKSEFQEALKNYRESLNLALEIKDPWTQALALNNIGCVELKRGNNRSAEEAHQEAYRLRTDLGMRHFAAETLNNLGLVWIAYADYPKALDCFEKSLITCDAVGSLSGRAWALHNRAFVFKDQGKFKESLESSQDAISIAEKIGDRRLEATAVLRLGNLFEYQGWFDQALEHYQKAAEIQKEISDWNFRSNTLSHAGDILAREGRAEEAEQHYKAAVNLKTKIGAKYGDILCKLALFFVECRRYTAGGGEVTRDRAAELARSLEYIERADREIKSDHVLDRMLLTYVKARYFLENDPTESLKTFKQLKSVAEQSGNRKSAFLATTGIGLALEALGNLEEAEKAFSEAVEYAERIRLSLDPVSRMTFLDGEEILGLKHVVPYEGLARVLLRKGDNEASLRWADFTKARAFAESVSGSRGTAFAHVPPDLLVRDVYLNDKLAGVMQTLQTAREQGTPAEIDALERELQGLSTEFDRNIEELRQKCPLFAATKYPQPLDLVHTALKDDEWVIVYDLTDPGILVYLLHGRKLVQSVYKPVTRIEVDRLVRKFRQPMEIVPGQDDPAEKLSSFDFGSGKALSDILVSDLLQHIPQGTPVVVIPDDSLGALPFEMLVLNDSGKIVDDEGLPQTAGTEFLGDRHPVSYYQSLTALTLVRTMTQKEKPHQRLLVVADPVFHQQDARAGAVSQFAVARADKEFATALMNSLGGEAAFQRLPLTGRLAEGLGKLFPGRSDIRTGFEASKERLMKEVAPQLEHYEKIVFATHGFFSKDVPAFREPVLVLTLVPLGSDGFLRMSEVMGLKLASDVVALTACQTGLGRHVSGEGTMGMGRAFQYAGADSVLMSLWSVAEASSVKLVESFFRHVREGKNKLDALQAARNEIRKQGFDHPFFWAAFIMSGEVR